MLAEFVQPTSRKPLRYDAQSVVSDPAYLSAYLRELVLRTYDALRASAVARRGDPPSGPEFAFRALSQCEWADLHNEIVQLEQTLNAHCLDSLASYVAALRQKVERCLA